MLPSVVAPPAPAPAEPVKPVEAIKPAVEPVKPAEAIKPAAESVKPAAEKRESFSDRIGRRVKEAEAEVAEAKTAGKTIEALRAEKVAAKAAGAKTPDPVKPIEAVKPAGDDLSDDQFKQQVDAETKGLDANKSKSWADLRYSERALKRAAKDLVPKTEVDALKQQLEAAKTAPVIDPTEITGLKAELAAAKTRETEHEQELMVAKVERTDAFKNGVTAPLEKVQTQITRIAKKYELNAGELMTALTDTSENQSDLIEAAIEKMNTLDKADFLSFRGDVRKANETAETLRANAKEALSKIEAKQSGQTEEQKTAAKVAREAAHTKNWQAVKDGELKDVLSPIENAPEWTKAQADAETFAKTLDFSGLTPDDQAAVAQRAAVYPLVMGSLQTAQTQLAEVQGKYDAALVRLARFEDNAAAGDSITEGPAKSAQDKETDFVKRVSNAVDRAKTAGQLR